MKAVEYVAKYHDDLTSDNNTVVVEAAKKIMVELNNEAVTLIQVRHAVKNSSLVSVLKEQNNKWNSILRHMSNCPLKKDGFKEFWLFKMPELTPYWS